MCVRRLGDLRLCREDYVVEKGDVDPESKTITLELVSKLIGQMSFDEETARRAVVSR